MLACTTQRLLVAPLRRGGFRRRLLPPTQHHRHYATVLLLNHTTKTAPAWPLQRRRGLASAAGGKGEGEEQARQQQRAVLIYKGGHGDVIRTLKRVSLTTCVIGLASTPFFLALGSEAVPMAANAALTGIVLLATCGPTVLLHAFTKPYIFSLRALSPAAPAAAAGDSKPATSSSSSSQPSPQRFRAETMDFLTRRAFSEFALGEVKPLPNSTRPFVTFEASGRLYFVHGETFADKALLVRFLGRPLKEAETAPVEPPFDEEAEAEAEEEVQEKR